MVTILLKKYLLSIIVRLTYPTLNFNTGFSSLNNSSSWSILTVITFYFKDRLILGWLGF